MTIHDLTITIDPKMPVWPGDPPVGLNLVSKIEEGAAANVTRLDISAHTGTHVDAPRHFIRDGITMESLDLNVLTGPALVVEFPDVTIIRAADLEAAGIPEGTTRVLFKTRNSKMWTEAYKPFDVNYVGVDEDASFWLLDHGVRLVGVDYLSVAPYEDTIPTHVALLGAGVVIVEGLNLSEIEPGLYQFYCLPLKIKGSDGAPARAILVTP